jgi:hypothetical protein
VEIVRRRLPACLLLASLLAASLPACSHLSQEDRTARFEARLERQDERMRERRKRRAIRARVEDERYHQWWDSIMGRGSY